MIRSAPLRITDVEAIVLKSTQDYASHAEESTGPLFRSLIRVRTDAGIEGWGEVETNPHVARAAVEAPGDGSGLFDGLKKLALGEDPFAVDRLWDKLYLGSIYYGRRGVAIQAISGIDIACHDIMGKALGLPVHALLGGARRERVPAYASTLFRETPEQMGAAARMYAAAGFRAVKFGWGGFGRDRARDVAGLRAAREALGPDRQLLIDAGWIIPRSTKDTLALVEATAPFDPYWVEEPCHPEDYAGYGAVAAGSRVRIAAGEQEATLWGFERLLREGRVDVVQPDLSRCGGFTVARKVIALAQLAGCSICPHAWMSDLMTASALHYNAVLPNALFQEFNVCDDPLSRALCRQPLRLVDGELAVPQGPGLGVELDLDVIDRHRV